MCDHLLVDSLLRFENDFIELVRLITLARDRVNCVMMVLVA